MRETVTCNDLTETYNKKTNKSDISSGQLMTWEYHLFRML